MLFRALSVILTSVVIALLPAGSAFAQDPGDPSAGSPPGVVYQLPLDQGRGDAAPNKGRGGADGSGGGGSGLGSGGGSGDSDDASFYRSENNFGSSSRVPGASGGASGETSGSAAVPLPSAADVDSGNTSIPESAGLLALIAAVGAGLAFMAIRARRHGQ